MGKISHDSITVQFSLNLVKLKIKLEKLSKILSIVPERKFKIMNLGKNAVRDDHQIIIYDCDILHCSFLHIFVT